MFECCNEDPLGPSLTQVCNASNLIVFATLLNSLIKPDNKISGICERVKPVKTPDEVYDFVVIGGGAAGSVVASRLSEIFNLTTLLLEAGGDEPSGAQIPGFATTFLKTNIIWDHKTTNEPHACLSTNRSCAWPSGKNLGGNTVHNGMICLRGIPWDYDNWASMGNEGWGWDDVKPIFLMSEDNGEIERVGRDYHATGGLLPVERFPYFPKIGYSFLEAADEVGFGQSEDLNGVKKTGFSIIQATNKKGVRRSSARAYLWPFRERKNLHISLNSLVTKIIIENKTAVGVEYYKDNELRTVRVKKEVIVSGGAMNSPQILLLSGIGPEDHLRSVGVPLVLNLPGVGKNFHDHPATVFDLTVNQPDIYDNNWVYAKEYLKSQTGPMSVIGLVSMAGMLSINQSNQNYPDIEVNGGGYFANCAPGNIGALQSSGRHGMNVVTSYLHPKSRGSVTLASNDPFELPILRANYFDDPHDLKMLVEGMKMVLKWLDAKALEHLDIKMMNLPLEACSKYKYLSDEYLACAAQHLPWALYHQGGSCKMGNSSDPMAVVDPRLRVYGIKGLRVADASIMPQIISSNTAVPTMMIGERAAIFIKEDYNL